jgi:hypothetical protein
MKAWLSKWLVGLGGIVVALLIYLNIRLYDTPSCFSMSQTTMLNESVFQQLQYIKHQIQEGHAAEEMQTLYPEGFVFMHALYALAWCDVLADLPPDGMYWQEGIQEVSASLDALDSPRGRGVFNPDLPLTYGAYYRGWTTYVRGRILQLTEPALRDTIQLQRFQNGCKAIETAIRNSDKPYLESYSGLTWPADNVICLAALALHDQVLAPRFGFTINTWVTRLKSTLSVDQPLIAHSYNLEKGQNEEPSRGASQALILYFIHDIDPVFGKSQYQIFRERFLAYRLGLPGIREYPTTGIGLGDIDSGPIVMGIGGAASITGIKTAMKYQDKALAMALHQGVSACLFPGSTAHGRRYLFGQLPILDAFMAWASADLCSIEPDTLPNWRWKCQLISVCVILLWVCGQRLLSLPSIR